MASLKLLFRIHDLCSSLSSKDLLQERSVRSPCPTQSIGVLWQDPLLDRPVSLLNDSRLPIDSMGCCCLLVLGADVDGVLFVSFLLERERSETEGNSKTKCKALRCRRLRRKEEEEEEEECSRGSTSNRMNSLNNHRVRCGSQMPKGVLKKQKKIMKIFVHFERKF